jgi:hypothetical protein
MWLKNIRKRCRQHVLLYSSPLTVDTCRRCAPVPVLHLLPPLPLAPRVAPRNPLRATSAIPYQFVYYNKYYDPYRKYFFFIRIQWSDPESVSYLDILWPVKKKYAVKEVINHKKLWNTALCSFISSNLWSFGYRYVITGFKLQEHLLTHEVFTQVSGAHCAI